MRVHVVDDSPDNRAIVRFFLEDAGIVVTESEHGQHALETLVTSTGADDAAPDLVLMDMMMPEMDGYETTRRLRAAGYARPIVALTALSLVGDRERCLACGCNDYVTKPIAPADLLRTVERCVHRD